MQIKYLISINCAQNFGSVSSAQTSSYLQVSSTQACGNETPLISNKLGTLKNVLKMLAAHHRPKLLSYHLVSSTYPLRFRRYMLRKLNCMLHTVNVNVTISGFTISLHLSRKNGMLHWPLNMFNSSQRNKHLTKRKSALLQGTIT